MSLQGSQELRMNDIGGVHTQADAAGRPSREMIRSAYDAAIRDIEAQRGTHQFENGFHRHIADAVFDGCYSALEHFSTWVEERGQADKATAVQLRAVRTGSTRNTASPRLHVV